MDVSARRDALCRRWGLAVTGSFSAGSTGWAGTVRGACGEELVLKVGRVHEESRDEADGMRLLAARPGLVPEIHRSLLDAGTSAILMERVHPGMTLAASALTAEEEDVVVSSLLRRLWIPAPGGPLRPLAEMCAWWADEAARRLARDPCGLPERVITRGLDLFRRLSAEWDGKPVLLATDLHHFNVLAATERPTTDPSDWRVVDVKPYTGDPHYDLLQHILNDPARLTANPAGLAGRMADLSGLDVDRARRWLFARCVQEAGVMDGAAEAAKILADGV